MRQILLDQHILQNVECRRIEPLQVIEKQGQWMKTLVIYCVDPRASDVPEAVAKYFGDERGGVGRVALIGIDPRTRQATAVGPAAAKME